MPRTRTRPVLAVLAVLAVAGATACAGPAPATTDTATDGAPRQGGSLAVGLPSDPTCIDPQQTGQRTATEISRQLVDSLTHQDPETGEIVPWLAESFSQSADGREFTFTLREGVTFSDGTPVDSQAVQATFNKLITFPAQGAPAYIRGYTGTRIVDDRTFVVGFEAANVQFLQATSLTGYGILSRATAAGDLGDRCLGQFVGSGPFVLESYTPNQEVVLTRRPGYGWAAASARNQGEAHLDGLRYVFVTEPAARSGALSSGQIHVAEDVPELDQAQFDGNGFALLTAINPGAAPPLSLNHRGVLADQRVRRALLIGIDRQELVDTVFGARSRPATSVLSSTTPYYTDQSELLRFDQQAAVALLDEAGWLPGPDGIRVRDGQPLRLVWLIPAPILPFKEHVQQQLRRIGVDIVLDVVPAPVYVERQTSGDFDLTAVDVTRADPDVLRNLFFTGGANLWHLPPSELDTYLQQQAGAADAQQRQQAVDNAVRHLLVNADTVPLYETGLVHGVADAVRDLRTDPSTRLTLHDAWLAE